MVKGRHWANTHMRLALKNISLFMGYGKRRSFHFFSYPSPTPPPTSFQNINQYIYTYTNIKIPLFFIYSVFCFGKVLLFCGKKWMRP